MKEFEITLPFPPSVNAMWRSINGRTILSKRGREYRAFALAILDGTLAPSEMLIEHLEVTIHLFPPTARKYDVDNFTKALFDALTHAKFWEDDELVYKMTVIKCEKKEGGLAILYIKPLEVANG